MLICVKRILFKPNKIFFSIHKYNFNRNLKSVTVVLCKITDNNNR